MGFQFARTFGWPGWPTCQFQSVPSAISPGLRPRQRSVKTWSSWTQDMRLTRSQVCRAKAAMTFQ